MLVAVVSSIADESRGIVIGGATGGMTGGATTAVESPAAVAASSLDETVHAERAEKVRNRGNRIDRIVKAWFGSGAC
jgi:hypothetical protein